MATRQTTTAPETFQRWHELRAGIGPYLDAIYPQVETLLADAENIIDLCGGDGHTHDVLANSFSSRMTTVDYDGEALERLKDRRPEVNTLQADATKLPIEDASFDAVIALNGIGGADSRAKIKEAKRVLRPGGTLVTLHDIPERLMIPASTRLEEFPPHARDRAYIVPYLNHPTGNVDVLAFVPQHFMWAIIESRHPSTLLIADEAESLLGNGWMEKIYGDTFKVGSYAKLFRRLVQAIQDEFGTEKVFLDDPMVPYLKKTQLQHMRNEGFEAEVITLGVDTRTEGPHLIEDREVSSLYVDEMTVPRVAYRKEGSQTGGDARVRGKMPVFVGHKSVTISS